MIRHVVCFKLKDPSPENCQKTREILESMRGNVPQIQELLVGVDFLHSARSYDLILEVTLESEDVLDAYQQDPYHVNVVKKHMHAVQESSIAIDFQL